VDKLPEDSSMQNQRFHPESNQRVV